MSFFRVPLPLSTLTVSMFSDSASMPVRGTASQKPPIGGKSPDFLHGDFRIIHHFQKTECAISGKIVGKKQIVPSSSTRQEKSNNPVTQRTFLPFRGSRFHG